MDRFEQLVTEAPSGACWIMLGNVERKDFEVFPVLKALSDETVRDYRARGFAFIGACGIVNGAPRTCLELPLDDESAEALCARVRAAVEAELERRLAVPEIEERALRDAFAFYMKHLSALNDPRSEA
jgi:hypothetical protein